MGSYFWIAVGSALGRMARFWFSGFVANRVGETFPFGSGGTLEGIEKRGNRERTIEREKAAAAGRMGAFEGRSGGLSRASLARGYDLRFAS